MILPPDSFKPGTGAHPPHLAGRDGEIQAMAPAEAAIEANLPPLRDGGYEPGIPSLLTYLAECVA